MSRPVVIPSINDPDLIARARSELQSILGSGEHKSTPRAHVARKEEERLARLQRIPVANVRDQGLDMQGMAAGRGGTASMAVGWTAPAIQPTTSARPESTEKNAVGGSIRLIRCPVPGTQSSATTIVQQSRQRHGLVEWDPPSLSATLSLPISAGEHELEHRRGAGSSSSQRQAAPTLGNAASVITTGIPPETVANMVPNAMHGGGSVANRSRSKDGGGDRITRAPNGR
jgi:hypothetical protein